MKPRAVPVYPPSFDEFWSLYPRKVAKVIAYASWCKWSCGDNPTAVIEGLRSQLPVFARRDWEHIPHPATWLNQRRWEDSVPRPGAKVTMIRQPSTTAELMPAWMGKPAPVWTAEQIAEAEEMLKAKGGER